LFSLPALADAQVVVNPAALAQLAGIAPVPKPVAVELPPVIAPHRHAVRRFSTHIAAAKPAAPLQAAARLAPPSTKPAPLAAPVATPAKPPAPAILQFADGSSALPGNAASSLQPFCKSGGIIGIDARAAGDASDPSIAMRLSLARALAVRDALVACGVPSQNILPRALGAVPGQNEDETVLGPEK